MQREKIEINNKSSKDAQENITAKQRHNSDELKERS